MSFSVNARLASVEFTQLQRSLLCYRIEYSAISDVDVNNYMGEYEVLIANHHRSAVIMSQVDFRNYAAVVEMPC